ncbi:MAG TPA: PaaI family thioesterase [Brevundimonas sp.]|uniref:PaaI family thioesterase n=1 Tax=Brevundimonas sp. TaxID=1871086 RepID=UPI002C02B04A|nr:PaaI family thioesterase [Brevundimonas sp.]HRH20267.1 PaaI family thioesterase [Brevundimonas sp.]
MTTGALAAALAGIPYARFLGVEAVAGTDDTAILRSSRHLIGNPMLPALHGGSVAGFMELTAIATLMAASTRPHPPRPIDVSVAYLRSGRPVDTFARAQIRKAGRRIAYVHVLAWQTDEAAPIAEMSVHFQLAEESMPTS